MRYRFSCISYLILYEEQRNALSLSGKEKHSQIMDACTVWAASNQSSSQTCHYPKQEKRPIIYFLDKNTSLSAGKIGNNMFSSYSRQGSSQHWQLLTCGLGCKVQNFKKKIPTPVWRIKSRRNKKCIAQFVYKSRDESNEPN